MFHVHARVLQALLVAASTVNALPPTPWRRLGRPAAPAAKPTSPLEGCKGFECLQQFVRLPDESYSWHDTKERVSGVDSDSGVAWTGYILNMTSQTWMTNAKVDFPLWWHIMVVVVPDRVEFKDYATLTLDFGVNELGPDGRYDTVSIHNRLSHEPADGPAMEINDGNLRRHLADLKKAAHKAAYIATHTRAVATSVLELPNGEETFADDPVHMRRTTDVLKAYTYTNFLDHPQEPERIMDLPVAKAVTRAMDTVMAFTRSLPTGPVSRFGVTGYSKLGMATWLIGALDERVKAIAPAAIPLTLRSGPPAEFAAPPFLAPLFRTYLSFIKPQEFSQLYLPVALSLNTQEFERLHSIIDPVAFPERLTVPKFYLMGTSDQVIAAEDQALEYLPEMPGHNSYLAVPNSEHDEILVKSLPSVASFFRGYLLGKSAPEIAYAFEAANGTIAARQASGHRPLAVRHWSGVHEAGGLWRERQLQEQQPGSGSWAAQVGQASAFLDFEYEWPEPGWRFRISTPMFSRASGQTAR